MKEFVTKEEIIEAIETEPLRAGSWFYDYDHTTNFETCSVCAVGAVLRRAGLKERDELDIDLEVCNDEYFGLYKLKDALSCGNFMGALSIKFEDLSEQVESMDEVREKLIKFVKENFPDEVELVKYKGRE